MKQTADIKAMRARFQPSKFSGAGFLGADAFSVERRIALDQELLSSLPLALITLLDALKGVHQTAKEADGHRVEVHPGITAQYYEARGMVPSPFKGEGTFEKGQTVVTHTATHDTFIITALSLHLIEKHAFFQGEGSPFRIAPDKVAQWFGLSLHASRKGDDHV